MDNSLGFDEAVWELVWNVARIAQMAVACLLFAWFIRRFSPRGWRIVSIAYLAVLLAEYWLPWEVPTATVYAFPSLVALAGLWIADRGRFFSQLFVCATFYSLRFIAFQLGSVAYSSLYDVLVLSATSQLGGFILCNVADAAVSSVLLWMAISLILRLYPDPHQPLGARECLLLLMPSAAAIVSFVTTTYVWAGSGYAGNGTSISWARAIQEIAGFASIVATVLLFSMVRTRQQAERRAQILAGQVEGMRSYIGRVEDMAASMRAVRHDLRGHMQTLQDLETAGAAEAALAYARAAEQQIGDTFGQIRTGNPATDVILSGFAREAEMAAIPFECSFSWPAGLGIDAFDMGVILHNALRNAMEAQEGLEERGIAVRSFARGRTFLVEVENRCGPAPPLSSAPASLPTTKADPVRHGLGLASIRAAAQKNGGQAEVSRRDGVFTLRVLLTGAQPDGGA